jgi:hypothetical protein
LHDIKLLLKQSNNKNDNVSNLLFKNIPFPLKLIKNDCFDVGGKINLKEFGINSVELLLIKNYDKNKNYLNLIKEPLVMFVYNNYLFFSLSPENVGSYDINAIDDEELSFIKYKFAIRDIIAILDIDGNVNFYENDIISKKFNLYDIKEINNEQKKKMFFSMGYAYYIKCIKILFLFFPNLEVKVIKLIIN